MAGDGRGAFEAMPMSLLCSSAYTWVNGSPAKIKTVILHLPFHLMYYCCPAMRESNPSSFITCHQREC